MARDLRAMMAAGEFTWEAPHVAPATLGGELTVTPWRFACSFLVTLGEWRLSAAGWRRLHGDSNAPGDWTRTESRCDPLADEIRRDSEFQTAFGFNTGAEASLTESNSSGDSTVEGLFAELMDLREQEKLLKSIEGPSPENGIAFLRKSFVHRREKLEASTGQLPENTTRALMWHVSRYRSNLLLVSSLQSQEEAGYWPYKINYNTRHFMKKSDIITSLDERASVRLAGSPALIRTVDSLIDLCGELGFEHLYDHLTEGALDPSGNGPLQVPLNVIPGKNPGACCELVVLLARVAGTKHPDVKFRQYMTLLKTHLLRCDGMTKLAVVMSDWWDGESFEKDHAAELSEWRKKGVEILILLAAQPDAPPTPLRVTL